MFTVCYNFWLCPYCKFWPCCMYEFNTTARVSTCQFFRQVIVSLELLSKTAATFSLRVCGVIAVLFLDPSPSRDKSCRRSKVPAFFPQIWPNCSSCVSSAGLRWQRLVACTTPRERKLADALSDVGCTLCTFVTVIFWFSSPPSSPSSEQGSGLVRSMLFPVTKHEVGSVWLMLCSQSIVWGLWLSAEKTSQVWQFPGLRRNAFL